MLSCTVCFGHCCQLNITVRRDVTHHTADDCGSVTGVIERTTTLRATSSMNSRIGTSILRYAATYDIARLARFSNFTISRRSLSTSTLSEPTLRRSYLYGPSCKPLSLCFMFNLVQSQPRRIVCSKSHSSSGLPQTLSFMISKTAFLPFHTRRKRQGRG